MNEPLANLLRPKDWVDFVGQEHLVGENGLIQRMLAGNSLFSMIFWGPPGCGKTTLARLIATKTNSYFIEYSATSAKIQEVREVINEAKERLKAYDQRTILFIDEIHRFNKAQQDSFLPYVENGTIILIGATTENPSFEVISPLLSRCKVFILKPLDKEYLEKIIDRCQEFLKTKIENKARELLLDVASGDARMAINTIEVVYQTFGQPKKILFEQIKEALANPHLLYDRVGEEHYNLVSCLHKTMRSSDPDASVYYLARMLEAGEDPLFIARRCVRFASEDIGNANPSALVIATAAFQACQQIGMPECNVVLTQCVAYLASSKKSSACYIAYENAKSDVHKLGALPVPLRLRNPVTKLMKEVGYGQGYHYSHEKIIDNLPEKLRGRKYYDPNCP